MTTEFFNKENCYIPETHYILGSGGWFVCNSAIIHFLASHQQVSASLGDAEYLREYGGVYDYLSCSSSRFLLMQNCLKNINAAIKYRLGPLLGIKRKNVLNNIFHQDPSFHMQMLKSTLWDPCQISIWASTLQKIYGSSSRQFILLQNPFYYPNLASGHHNIWGELFPSRTLLYVFRNPRDQFADLWKNNQLVHTKMTRFREGSENMSPVDRFFFLNEKILDGRELLVAHEHGRMLGVSFDRFISNFEQESKRIRHFFGLSKQNSSYSQDDFRYSASNANIWQQNPAVMEMIQKNNSRFDDLEERNLNLMKKMSVS